MIWFCLKLCAALGVALLIYLVGAGVVRNFARGHAQPDENDDVVLSDVDYRFRCVVCGAEVLMYAAPDGEVPMAPRHCAERMDLIAPVT
jgi:hypothetical protein